MSSDIALSIPHEVRAFKLTSISKTHKFSSNGYKVNNFDHIELLKIVQALGDKDSFALIPG